MSVELIVAAVMLSIGAVLALIRLEKGPSILDRALALDIITSSLIIGVAIDAAWRRRVDTVPVLAALALVGFLASVSITRFASVEPEDAKRIRTQQEVAAEEEARRRAEEEAARAEAEAALRRDEEAGP